MNSQVGNGIVPSCATGELAARNDGDALEVLCATAGDGVGHASAIREANAEPLFLIDTELRLDLLDHCIYKSDIVAIRVCPAVGDTLRCDEDSAFVSNALHTVVSPLFLVGPARGNVLHGAADPMEAEDQLVRAGVGVVVWYADNVLALLTIYGNGFCAAAGRRFTTS